MSANEKTDETLLPAPLLSTPSVKSTSSARKLIFAVVLIWTGFACRYWVWDRAEIGDMCPQADVLYPHKNEDLWIKVSEIFGTGEFKNRSIDWLAGAVRIPTETFDGMDSVGIDPRWEAFIPFHEYLPKAFPLVHANLQLTKVNTFGLVYLWQGTDETLKPILLAAHQDVVPVDPTTFDQWKYPPYSGYFDGKRLWGRGSQDDKSGLIGIMSSVESLLENNFGPTRSVVLAFGFDEEANGDYGAAEIGKYLLSTYGEDAFALLIDEGAGFSQRSGSIFAVPGIAEKGCMNVEVEVTTLGGHSSLPPAHTSIGILSALLVHFEANPFKSHLTRASPVYGNLKCLAAHAPGMSRHVRRLVKRSVHSDRALHALEKIVFKDPILKSLTGTTQAIDMIKGGIKSNALPERAWALVNHRVSTESSIASVRAHDTRLLKKLAAEFNLTYEAFGVQVSGGNVSSGGSLQLIDHRGTLEPAPITPTGKDVAAFQLLSGTIKATFNSHRMIRDSDEIVVSPGIMSGNTDTRHYWALTKHIYRYTHHNEGDSATPLAGFHTVNESMDMDAFVEMIRFFATLILNADESTDL
jgi:Gly-Xaa carboxypeptidase